jgi:hypothetical protein
LSRTVGSLFSIIVILMQAWTPPEKPDPSRILEEAKTDAIAGRYEDALAKQVWFHENALKYQPSLTGVRLSFALSQWLELGARYTPAMEKLKAVRDETARRIRDVDGTDEIFGDFADFSAINKTLNEVPKTHELFVWLDAHKPALSPRCFNVAQPALIKAKDYRLCGKYIDANRDFEMLRHAYRTNLQLAQKPKFGKELRDFGEKMFSNGASTLVALLVVNGRKEEAHLIAEAAAKELDDPSFRDQLKAAENGTVPEPWP